MRRISHREFVSMWIATFALIIMPILKGQQEDKARIRSNAIALEQQGQNAEAEQLWATIAKSDPQNAEALAHLGLLEARQDHYDAAIAFYRQAAAINSDLPGLQMNLGLALFKAAQFPDAIKSFASEFRKHPGDRRLPTLLAMAHYGMKDYLVAIPCLQRAAELDPQNQTLRMTLAHSCMWSKQYQCVLDVHKEIVALNGESAEADMLAGEALDQLHENVAAEKEFRAAILKNPREPNVHFGMGYLLWTESKWLQAADEFQLELQNDPRHVQARIYLADVWVQQHEFAKALPELEKLVAGDQSEQFVHRDLGIIYADSGRGADAIREFTMATITDPDDKEPHFQIAKLYRSMGRADEANAELNKARKLPPRSHPSLQELIDSIENPLP